jgi:hypothetical protein
MQQLRDDCEAKMQNMEDYFVGYVKARLAERERERERVQDPWLAPLPAETPSLDVDQPSPDKEIEDQIISSMDQILLRNGSIGVGHLGSLLRKELKENLKSSEVSKWLKDNYGGLKRFVISHDDDFILGTDHQFNPHVSLTHARLTALRSTQWL